MVRERDVFQYQELVFPMLRIDLAPHPEHHFDNSRC